jgi:hypothetical protein
MSRTPTRPLPLALLHALLGLALFAVAGCAGEDTTPPGDDLVEDELATDDLLVEPPVAPAPTEVGLGVIERRLYPPGLVLDHQARIGLTDAQRAAILQTVRETQTELVDRDAALRASVETLGQTLEEASVDEARALSEVEAVMEHERGVKRAHFLMLIRVRAQLTEAQREQLDELREG